MDLAELMVRVKADVADYTKGMDSVKGGATSATGPTNTLGSAMKGMASAATGGLILKTVGGVVMDTVGSLSEMNRVQTQTTAALESTGSASGMTGEAILALADNIEGLTGIDQNAIQTGENLLLTFTNIKDGVGAGNDIFSQSTSILTDMSVALGTDVSGSAIQLGKALNDPIAGVGALSRVGVTFTAQQKDQIKALVESGDVMGAQKIILAELTKEFGGSAAAYGTTMPGAIARAKNAFQGILEGVLVPMVPLVVKLADFVRGLAEKFSNLPGPVKMAIIVGGGLLVVLLGIGMIVGPIIAAIGGLGAVMGVILGPIGLVIAAIVAIIAIVVLCIKYHEEIKAALIAAWNAIKDALIAAWDAIKGAGEAVWGAITGFFSTIWDAVKSVWETVWNAIKDFFVAWWPVLIGIFLGPIGILGGLIYKFHDEIWAKIQAVWGAIKSFLETIWNAIKGAGEAVWNALKTAFEAIWNTIKKIADTIFGAIKAFFDLWWGTTKAIFTGNLGALKDLWSGAWDKVKAIFETIWGAIKGVMIAAWNAIKAPFVAAWDAIKTAFSSAWTAIKTAFDSAWEGLKGAFDTALTWIKGIPSKITSALANLGSLLKDIGKAIIQGLWDGMTAIWDRVWGWLKGLASKIASVWPFSEGPLGESGRKLILGLGMGMKSQIPGVLAIASDLSKALSGSMTISAPGYSMTRPASATGGGTGRIGGTVVNATITILGQGAPAGEAAANALIRRLGAAGVRL